MAGLPCRSRTENQSQCGLSEIGGLGNHGPGGDPGLWWKFRKSSNETSKFRKNSNPGAGSEPQSFPPIPERVVVHPKEQRGPALVPPRHAEYFLEIIPFEHVVRSPEVEPFRGDGRID